MSPQPALLVHRGEHLARLLERRVGRGHAAVDRGLQQDLADLVLGDAVAERGAHVQLELLLAVQRGQHGEVEQAPGLARQARPIPHGTPAVLGDQILIGPGESRRRSRTSARHGPRPAPLCGSSGRASCMFLVHALSPVLVRRESRSASRLKRSACSMLRRCAAWEISTKREPGMRSCRARMTSTVVAGSSAPATIRVGVRIARTASLWSMSRIAAQQAP